MWLPFFLLFVLLSKTLLPPRAGLGDGVGGSVDWAMRLHGPGGLPAVPALAGSLAESGAQEMVSG